jgi:hypothetical protein
MCSTWLREVLVADWEGCGDGANSMVPVAVMQRVCTPGNVAMLMPKTICLGERDGVGRVGGLDGDGECLWASGGSYGRD